MVKVEGDRYTPLPTNPSLKKDQFLVRQEAVDHIRGLVYGSLQTPERYNSFLSKIDEEANAFRSHYEHSGTLLSLQPEREKHLNQWVESAEGMHTTRDLVDELGSLVSSLSSHGSVAHDTRHVLLKDPLAALRQIVEDRNDVHPYQKFVLVGSLLHDFGRLMEPIAYSQAGKEIGLEVQKKHPAISFYVANLLFQSFPDFPDDLKQQILYAVLTHQDVSREGEPISDVKREFIPQAVKQADREQILGAEGVSRLLTYNGGMHNAPLSSTPDTARRETLDSHSPYKKELSHIMEYHMRRNPANQYGENTAQHTNILKAITGTYLWLSSTNEMREIIFAPELARDRGEIGSATYLFRKHILPLEVWEMVKESSMLASKAFGNRNKHSTTDIMGLVREIATADGAVHTPELFINLHQQIAQLSSEEITRLAAGLTYVINVRKILDAREKTFLQRVLSAYPENSIESLFAYLISSVWKATTNGEDTPATNSPLASRK